MGFWKKISAWSAEAKTGLVLSLAATIIFGSVLVFQQNEKGHQNTSLISSTTSSSSSKSIEIKSVVSEETMIRPFRVEAVAVRYFFDMNDPLEKRTKSVVKVPGKNTTYMKSVGVDYSFNDTTFDVVASFSGKVIDKVTDSIYGNMVFIQNGLGLQAIYCSLGKINVTKDQMVTQGQVIGQSGNSLYTTGLGSSLHFEVIKDGKNINPEKIYTSVMSQI